MTIIGIDLGTTHSCVSYFEKGKVEVFENNNGRFTTPSYVAFTENEMFAGNEAKLHSLLDPQNVVFDAKRLIGRRFDDNCVQEDIQRNWPFTVINEEGTPMIKVKYLKETRTFIPEFISAKVLECMKEIAESKTGINNITAAVVTVPAYFNDSQREATRVAAEIAGFTTIRLISEPTAAAIAFIFQNKDINESNIVVYDLGGGTFDVSVLNVSDGRIIVKAVNGDTHLGGNDFDELLLEHFLNEIRQKYKKDLREKRYTRSLYRLREACENAKISLSGKQSAVLKVDALFNGKDFESTITRATFEDLCFAKMLKTLGPIEQALKDAKLTAKDVNHILLVGGSTRIPKIKSLVQEFFNGAALNKSINPDEAVARGAAILAAILRNDCSKELVGIRLTDVVPLSYGIEDGNRLMSVIIPRNTQYPIRKTNTYITTDDNRTDAILNVYQGEREVVSGNHLLTSFEITNLPRKLAGEVELSVTMEINEDGILVVSVVEKSTGVNANAIVTNSLGRLSKEKIEKLIAESEVMKENDLKYKEILIIQKEIESLINDNNCLRRVKSDCLKDIIEGYKKRINVNSNATKEELEAILKILKARRRDIECLTDINRPCVIS